ncbi:hypothetical protein K1718_13270 [Roseibium porphyridii]|uniref:Holin of 3TMs, for gene-transfer release n=1 Tax=Roseibium porphyridii TaxID=2866279 RepID=A0ABY8F9W8_9HYPH|nr:hypothetical protein [Roseibium sp. KMA01]WFE92290.1 hypothetical protein K1718_13270 [Roseibium sp. KMA01]
MFLLSWILKFASSGLVDKALLYMERKAVQGNERERIKSQTTIEVVRSAVQETRIMADLQKSKFEYVLYWVFAGLFVLPLGFWWAALILDSVFLFGWGVDTVPILEDWGGQMIRWLFYTSTVVGAIKMLK